MSRAISIELQDHLDSRVTTYAMLLKIQPVDGAAVGTTNLDEPLIYLGLTYTAHRGFNESTFAGNEGQAVDNGEAEMLFAPDVGELGITVEQVNAGHFDDAYWVIYLVNYDDLSQGHMIIGSGRLGEIRSVDGMLGAIELRWWSQLAKQKSVIWPTSITCLATYGDATTGCGAALTWSATQTVTSVGDEADRQFTCSGLAGDTGFYDFGLWEWLTGDNAGKSIEIEMFTDGGIVGLAHPAPFAIQVGDTGRPRQDCGTIGLPGKTFAACKARGQHLNFRGLPHLPVADGDSLQTPGNIR